MYNAYHRIWNDNKEFRLEILKERNFICFQCKIKLENKDLQCHHKIPVLKRPDLAFKKDNIILVCTKCHRNIHISHPELNNKLKNRFRNLDDFL